jgi:phytoene dehydrogenase-like protein
MLFAAPAEAGGECAAREVSGSDGLVVFCPGNYAQEQALCRAGKRSFERFKRTLAVNVIEILEQNVFPGIRAHVRYCEVVSSIDTARDTMGELGNAYGRRLSAQEMRKGPIRMKKVPQNLFNVSATCNSPGIAAGIATGARILEQLTGIRL